MSVAGLAYRGGAIASVGEEAQRLPAFSVFPVRRTLRHPRPERADSPPARLGLWGIRGSFPCSSFRIYATAPHSQGGRGVQVSSSAYGFAPQGACVSSNSSLSQTQFAYGPNVHVVVDPLHR